MRVVVVVERVSGVAGWILFVSLLVIASSILLFSSNVPLFLAVLCMSLFVLPKKWAGWEFQWRLCFFLLTGIFLEILLFLLLPSLGASGYIYVIAAAVPMAMSLILLSDYKWRVSRFISTENILIVAVLLAALILLNIVGPWKLKEGLLGFSILLVMLLMLNYIPSSLRRSELFNFLSKFGDFNTPIDFIEEILRKANKEEGEEADFIRFRFKEFLDQIERGDMEHAYVTLATGMMELLKIWDGEKGQAKKQLVSEWENEIKGITHDQIRASIVHSIPPKRRKKKWRKLDKDLQRKRQILNKFKNDPYTPIKDLLKKAAKKYELE